MTSKPSRDPKTCDIFLSCSHNDPHVKKILNIFQSQASNVSTYITSFEEDEVSQQLRYQAAENCLCMLVVITTDYLKTRICLEEFNLGLARQSSQNAFHLLPIYRGAVETVPRSLSSIPWVDVSGDDSQLETLASIVYQIVKQSKELCKNPDVKLLKEKMEEKRTAEFTDKFRLDAGNVIWNTTTSSLNYGLTSLVVILCDQDCLTFAGILSVILKQHAPGLTCELRLSDDSPQDDHLASADLVVISLSDQFAASLTLVSQLHTALCRQQATQDSTILYIIQSKHHISHPLFLHVLPVSLCLEDKIWRRLERACSNRNPRYTVNLKNAQGLFRCTAAQNLALTAAAFDIIHTLSQRGSGSTITTNVINLAKQDNELKGLKDNAVSLHQHIMSLDSLRLRVTQRSSSSVNSKILISVKELDNHDIDVNDQRVNEGKPYPSTTENLSQASQGTSHGGAISEIFEDDFKEDETLNQSQADTFSTRTSMTSLTTTASSNLGQNFDDVNVENHTVGFSKRQFSVTCRLI